MVDQFDYAAHLAGQTLWIQGAWADGVTGQFKLTTAEALELPRILPLGQPRRRAIGHWDQNATSGLGPYAGAYYTPVFRYRH